MSAVTVEVTEFTVQYVLKDIERDIPRMLPLNKYSVDLELEIPDTLQQYLPAYVEGMKLRDNPDIKGGNDGALIPAYGAPKEVVKKWKKFLMENYDDAFDKSTGPDMVIDSAISCTLEDSIKDSLESLWDETLEESLGAAPEVPPGYRRDARFIHLVDWKVK